MALAVVMLDDNPDDLDIMALAAAEVGALVLEGTDDPDRALALLQAASANGSPTAVLLDWHLAGETSPRFLASVRADASVAHSHVVVNSGSDDPADRAAALAAGADGYSVKPAGFDASIALLTGLVAAVSASPGRSAG